jgi:transcription elongation factor GreA
MFSYFAGFLKSLNQVNEQVVASYLLIKDLAGQYPHLGAGLKVNFLDIFDQIEDVAGLYDDLKDNRLREEFIHHIELFVPRWEDIYVKLFPREPLGRIIASLEKEGMEDKLAALTVNCFENFRDCREAVFWLFKNMSGTSWYKKAGIPFEKQLITLIHILDLSYREIENRRDTAKNRKINKLVYSALFKDEILASFIQAADEDAVIRLYTFINDVKDLDPADKIFLKDRILSKFPDFKFFGDTEKKVSRGLIVTVIKYEEKQRQLAHIMDVEVPANSKEIAFALSLGDLRENAEYKAAKEKQELLNSTVAKLKDEIERAQLFDPATVNANRVSFGTRVTLLNGTSGKREEYTILGPWESDPENRIISYLSPFGGAILNKAVGDDVDFSINDEKVSYRVEGIFAAL